MCRLCAAFLVLCFFTVPAPAAEEVSIGAPVFDSVKGVWRYAVNGPYQKGANAVEVLLPDDFRKTQKYRVLYVLPVETGISGNFGDGIQVVRAVNAHNLHHFICVQMAFDTVPWFGDHPTDPHIRQEQYLKKVIVPMIEERYPVVGGREGRLLLGFSKSGWGAFTLILRDPDFFGYAASWDAPLMMGVRDFTNYAIPEDMGTRENFAKYLPVQLAREHPAAFKDRPRLVLLGHQLFGREPGNRFHDQTAEMHDLLVDLAIPHIYDNSVKVPHTWNAGWVKPAIEALASLAK